MRVERIGDAPLIDAHTRGYDPTIHNNINGPALMRVPDWVVNPLGRYYLYFAHHNDDHIRMAYADELTGPYTILEGGVMNFQNSRFEGHIASPDVYVDHEVQQIRLYYHGVTTMAERETIVREIDEFFFSAQRTRVAASSDGITFDEQPPLISSAYLRVVRFKGMFYGITMPGLLYRSVDGFGEFERGPLLFGDDDNRERYFFYGEEETGRQNPRHFAVQVIDDRLRLYFSLVPDTPESIYLCDVDTSSDDWRDWTHTEPVRILQPERDHEGGDLPMETSARGTIMRRARQLRDPAIYEEDGHVYLLYSTAGEMGIALAEVINI